MGRTLSERHRRTLTAELREQGLLSSPQLERAFHAVARERFVPHAFSEGGLAAVYRDDVIITKRDALGGALSASSQPAIMALMLELLDVQPGHHVLEVGAGTGYNAALLAHLVGPNGRVTSIDIDPQLVRTARRALRDSGVRVAVRAGDGREGFLANAPYDRIIVTASADEIPRAWRDHLREGGRLVAPLRLDPDGAAIQLIPALERRGQTLQSVDMTWGGFMPLHDGDGGRQRPVGNLSVVHSVANRHSGLISLTGAGVGQLTERGARDLLSAMLAKPRTPRQRGVTDAGRGQPSLLLTYLMLNIPAQRRIWLRHAGRWGIGLVNRQSVATVSLPTATTGADPTAGARWRLDAWTGERAGAELSGLLDQRRQLDREGRRSLHVTASGDTPALRVSFRW